MNDLSHLASGYRLRAEKVLSLADTDSCQYTREALLRIAESYLQMAATADNIERSYHLSRLN